MADGIDIIEEFEKPMANPYANADQLLKNKLEIDASRKKALLAVAEGNKTRAIADGERANAARLEIWKMNQASPQVKTPNLEVRTEAS